DGDQYAAATNGYMDANGNFHADQYARAQRNPDRDEHACAADRDADRDQYTHADEHADADQDAVRHADGAGAADRAAAAYAGTGLPNTFGLDDLRSGQWRLSVRDCDGGGKHH